MGTSIFSRYARVTSHIQNVLFAIRLALFDKTCFFQLLRGADEYIQIDEDI